MALTEEQQIQIAIANANARAASLRNDPVAMWERQNDFNPEESIEPDAYKTEYRKRVASAYLSTLSGVNADVISKNYEHYSKSHGFTGNHEADFSKLEDNFRKNRIDGLSQTFKSDNGLVNLFLRGLNRGVLSSQELALGTAKRISGKLADINPALSEREDFWEGEIERLQERVDSKKALSASDPDVIALRQAKVQLDVIRDTRRADQRRGLFFKQLEKWEAETRVAKLITLEDEIPEVDPELEQSFLGQVAEGGGNLMWNIAAFAPSKVVGLTAGVLGEVQETVDDARANGRNEADALESGVAQLPAATAEALIEKTLVTRFFKPLKGKMTMGQLSKNVASAAGSEGVAEGVQQFWQNLNAKILTKYDKNRVLDDGVLMSVALGMVLGAGPSTATGAVNLVFPSTGKLGNTPDSSEEWRLVRRHHSDEEITDAFGELGLDAANGGVEAQQTISGLVAGRDPFDHSNEVLGPLERVPDPKLTERQARDAETAALNLKAVSDTRQALGLDDLPANQQTTARQALREVENNPQLVNRAEDRATVILEKGGQLSSGEQAAAAVRMAQLQNEFESLAEESANAIRNGDRAKGETLSDQSQEVLAKIDKIQRASSKSVSAASTAMNLAKMRIRLTDYSLAGMTNRATALKGKTLTTKELGELKRLSDKLKDLQAKVDKQDKLIQKLLGSGVTSIKKAKNLSTKDKRKLVDLLIDVEQAEQDAREAIDNFRKRGKLELASDIAATPRALIATGDISGTLRQGGLLSAAMPVKSVRNVAKSLKAVFSQRSFKEIDLELRSRSNFKEAEAAGIFHASLDRLDLNSREERFQSLLAERIPVVGRIVKASERHMAAYLNMTRAAAIDTVINDLNRRGIPFGSEQRFRELKAAADFINAASGRGSLGGFEKSARGMATVFFAPRFAVSRPETLVRAAIALKSQSAGKFAVRALASYAGVGMALLTLAVYGDAEVGEDPDNSDFGKIRVGDTRIDIWGGFTPFVRLMINAWRAGPLTDDGPSNRDILSQSGRFLLYKASPTLTIPAEAWTGEDVVGNEVSWFNDALWDPASEEQNLFLKNATPLWMQEAARAMSSDSPESVIYTAPLEFIGIGVQTFED